MATPIESVNLELVVDASDEVWDLNTSLRVSDRHPGVTVVGTSMLLQLPVPHMVPPQLPIPRLSGQRLQNATATPATEG